jgi:isoquinoline 1-oxidoreductase subunit alpha
MIKLEVNGRRHTYSGDPTVPLLWVLRDEFGLTGTKFGCGAGFCGACTVHLAGEAVHSCSLPVSAAVGKPIVTIEGLDPQGDHPVQKAWRETSAPQCGYCHAGQIMRATALLAKTPKPTDAEIVSAMNPNICRCGCYQRIAEAVRLASTGV